MTTVRPVPVRLRVGVTGHRALADERAIADRVDEILMRLPGLLPPRGGTPVLLEVVSPLGEGADRIVAERILETPEAILEVPLPLQASDYEEDFETALSRERFRALLARAERTWVVGGHRPVREADGRIDAYRVAGAYVVDSCDVLIAVWDGQAARGPGGTAEMVARAQDQAMPVFRIEALEPYDVEDPAGPIAPNLIPAIARLNERTARSHQERIRRMAASATTPGGNRLPVSDEGSRLHACTTWIGAVQLQAAAVAGEAQRRFTWGSRALFLLSSFAILAVALSVTARDETLAHTFAYIEVGLIIVALALWLAVRRRLHGRWIEARFLTERLRAACFLAFAGSTTGIGSTPSGDRGGDSQEWINRVCREIWRTRPRFTDTDRSVDEVKAVLTTAWVARQLRYYADRAHRHRRASHWLSIAGITLLAGTIVAAVSHAAELVHGGLADLAVVLAISLPAFAGAVAGIAALELHARHADRFTSMVDRLRDLQDRLAWAPDLDRIRAVAARVEAELRTEGEAWIDVMRFQDVEPPA